MTDTILKAARLMGYTIVSLRPDVVIADVKAPARALDMVRCRPYTPFSGKPEDAPDLLALVKVLGEKYKIDIASPDEIDRNESGWGFWRWTRDIEPTVSEDGAWTYEQAAEAAVAALESEVVK